jgi:lipoate-protein ligase A
MRGKIIGSAQKRWPDGLLQQGSIPFSPDRKKTAGVFGIQPLLKPNNGLRGLKDIIPDLNPGVLKEAIRVSFEEIFDVNFFISSPSKEEVSLAHELESLKYSASGWTFRR